MALVERHSPRVGRFEERGYPICVYPGQTVPEKRRAESVSLQRGVDTQPWQVPVRLLGMSGIHLLKHREGVGVLLAWDRFAQRRNDRIPVRFSSGRSFLGAESSVSMLGHGA